MSSTSLSEKLPLQFSHLKFQLTKRNFWLLLLSDLVLIITSYNISYYIRFIDTEPLLYRYAHLNIQPLIIMIKLFTFYSFGMYRGMWRYTSYTDLINIFKGTCVASIVIVSAVTYLYTFQGFSRSVFIIDALITFLLISGNRVSIRFGYQKLEKNRSVRRNQYTGLKKSCSWLARVPQQKKYCGSSKRITVSPIRLSAWSMMTRIRSPPGSME